MEMNKFNIYEYSKLNFYQPKKRLKKPKHKQELMNAIVEKITEIKDHLTLKLDNELLIFVCSCIENGLKVKKKGEVNKKELCLEIYQKIFSINANEKEQISKSIDFLCDNKMIEKVPMYMKYSTIFKNYVKSKL